MAVPPDLPADVLAVVEDRLRKAFARGRDQGRADTLAVIKGLTELNGPLSRLVEKARDASGHEHRGKGKGGGQFTSGGGGDSGAESGKEPAEKPNNSGGKGGGPAGGRPVHVSIKRLKAVQEQARAKHAAAPVPTAEEAADNGRKMDEMGADRFESGARGNSTDRASSRKRLLAEFGDGETCPCVYCGLVLDDSTVTRDKIYTARQGGKYRQNNLVPACLACNKKRSDKPFTEIKWQA